MSVFKVAFNKLRMFKNPRVPLAFTSDAADLFFEFRQYTNSLDAETSGPLLGWVGKGNGVVARLAAILTILDWAFSDSQSPPPFVVKRDAVLRAGQLWAEYLYPMARRAFGDAFPPMLLHAGMKRRNRRSHQYCDRRQPQHRPRMPHRPNTSTP